MNIVCISGRITHTPELKQTPNGKQVCTFTLAVDRPKVKDVTDFYNFVAWEHTADYVARYANKGDTVEVSGYLTARSYEDRSGAKRTAIEIKVDEAHIFRKLGQNAPEFTPNVPTAEEWQESTKDDDLPF